VTGLGSHHIVEWHDARNVASDREAARLAAKENRADLIAGVDLSSEDRDVTRLLIDLAQRDSMNASADFAALLQKSLMPRGVVFREQFHRFAGFAVLKNLGVPAVLVETGYLSNPADAAYLRSDRGRRAIAEGVADAVSRFLKGD
jgi:N-acetylmuramoyl-L-alanine amidase